MSNKERNWDSLRRLYNSVVLGAAGWINSEKDAVQVASVLRALANEFDPNNTEEGFGDKFLDKTKELIRYNEESE